MVYIIIWSLFYVLILVIHCWSKKREVVDFFIQLFIFNWISFHFLNIKKKKKIYQCLEKKKEIKKQSIVIVIWYTGIVIHFVCKLGTKNLLASSMCHCPLYSLSPCLAASDRILCLSRTLLLSTSLQNLILTNKKFFLTCTNYLTSSFFIVLCVKWTLFSLRNAIVRLGTFCMLTLSQMVGSAS